MTKDTTHEIVRDYFHEQVQLASFNQNIQITSHAEYYVVDLLSQFSHIHQNPAEELSQFKEKPLALYLLESLESKDKPEQQKLLKELGDLALFTAGFFSESIEKQSVDIEYYIHMGSGAYSDLSLLVERSGLAQTFDELSYKFNHIVELLSEISENSGLQKNADLLKLYEKYQQDKSPRLEKKLIQLGFMTHPENKSLN